MQALVQTSFASRAKPSFPHLAAELSGSNYSRIYATISVELFAVNLSGIARGKWNSRQRARCKKP